MPDRKEPRNKSLSDGFKVPVLPVRPRSSSLEERAPPHRPPSARTATHNMEPLKSHTSTKRYNKIKLTSYISEHIDLF